MGTHYAWQQKTGKNNKFHFHEAMQQPDRDEFIKAMAK